MWQLVNRTPFAAGQAWARNLDGAETWIVCVKATFDVRPDGSTEISPDQPIPTRAPVYSGEPGRSSIKYDNDYVLDKATTDIVVNGNAYAPGGRPAFSVDVGFRVGPVTKTLRVVGDRTWTVAGAPSAPKAFVVMPISYERAFGGVDAASAEPDRGRYWRNPVGTGFSESGRGITHLYVPNVEYADDAVQSWRDRPRPAGFGFVGPDWEDRARLAGTYDRAWGEGRQPLLPDDFDIRHYQGAPKDQQPPTFLLGGEPVSLVNLSESGELRFLLPTMTLRLETRFEDDERREHPVPRLHTVILEPDFPRVSLVWHSAIECHSKVYQLERTYIEAPGITPDGEDEPIDSLMDL